MRSALILLLVLMLAAPAAAHGKAPHMDWVISVRNGPCLGGAPFCFEVDEGTRDPVDGGTEATITVRNHSNNTHHYFVAPMEVIDRGRTDTKPDISLANVRVESGGSGVMGFDVPKYTKGIYFWCDEDGHEINTDWLVFDVKALEKKESPPVALPLLLAGLALAALVRRR